jgi:O-antigen ligase
MTALRGVATAPGRTRRAATAVRAMVVDLDPLRLFMFLLTALTVSRIHQRFPVVAAMRPALVMVALAGGYALLNPRKLAPDGLFRAWQSRLVAVLFVWACVAAPFGISLGASAKLIITEYSKTIIYCFLLIVTLRNARDLYGLMWGYLIGCLLTVWMALFLFGLSRAGAGGVERLSSLYSFDANDIGVVLIIGLALALLAFQVGTKRAKVVSVVLIAGIGATIARSGSRGTFLGLVVFGLALLAMLRTVPLAKRLGFLALTAIALAIAAPSGYWQQMSTIWNPSSDYNVQSVDGRVAVAKRGVGYMLSYPVFGLGIGNFGRAECTISVKAENYVAGTGIRCTPPHNSYIEAGAELGFIGLGLWSSLVVGGIVSMIRLRRRLPAAWQRGDVEERFLYLSTMYLALAMIGFAVTSYFLSFAWIDIVYILTAFMAAVHLAATKKLHGVSAAAPVVMPRRPTGRRRPIAVTPTFMPPAE